METPLHRGPRSPVKTSALPRLSKLPTLQPRQSVVPPAAGPLSPLKSPQKKPALVTRRVSGIPPSPAVHTAGHIPRPASALATARPLSSTKHAFASSTSSASRPLATKTKPIVLAAPKPSDARPSPDLTSPVRSKARPFTPLSPPLGSSPFVAETPTPRYPDVSTPSLSDRTKESLARLPSTPATDRRRSGVFTPISPRNKGSMRPPPRPASALSIPKRPGSSLGLVKPSRGTTPSIARAAAPSATPNRATPGPPRPGTGRRSMSANIPRASLPVSTPRPLATPAHMRTKSATPHIQPPRTVRHPGSKTALAAPGTARKPPPPTARSSTSTLSSPHELSDMIEEETVVSSIAYKQAIQDAKASAKKQSPGKAFYDIFHDPFNQRPINSNNRVVLQLVDSARRDGKLNISGLGLDDIPKEVLAMFDASSMAASGTSWNDVVDLTTFDASGNRLAALSEDAFPAYDSCNARSTDEFRPSIFANVQKMDLRKNKLTSIPDGMLSLDRLTVLNLSRNDLGLDVFDVLTGLTSLRELVLAGNGISGFIPKEISQLKALEILDLRDNKFMHIPDTVGGLDRLRVLNLGGNQLTGLPMDALQSLPLTELDVSRNALIGALFPFGVGGLKHLEDLNVTDNCLASLAFSESVSLPNIRILKMSNNRFAALPDLSTWSELVTLAAGGNKLSTIPHGFSALRRLRHADFSSNDITRLDPRIASMDSLESLVVSANPLEDQRFLSMSADAIKSALRVQLEADESMPVTPRRSEESFEDEAIDMRSPEARPTPYKITHTGALDITGQGLDDQDSDGLRYLLGLHDVQELQLSRNNFTVIPFELSLAQHLQVLDLSMCQLGNAFAQELLVLPSLQTLQLSGNKITSLETLIVNFQAPSLRFIDVSNNLLEGELPRLREAFENLEEIHATDNRISSISVEAVKGLTTLTLARNDIRALPAEIGLLWFEGLKELDVGGNAFKLPGRDVLEQGTEPTLAWLRGKIPDYPGDDVTF